MKAPESAPAYVTDAVALVVEAKRVWFRVEVYTDNESRHTAAAVYDQAVRALHKAVDVWVAEASKGIPEPPSIF